MASHHSQGSGAAARRDWLSAEAKAKLEAVVEHIDATEYVFLVICHPVIELTLTPDFRPQSIYSLKNIR